MSELRGAEPAAPRNPLQVRALPSTRGRGRIAWRLGWGAGLLAGGWLLLSALVAELAPPDLVNSLVPAALAQSERPPTPSPSPPGQAAPRRPSARPSGPTEAPPGFEDRRGQPQAPGLPKQDAVPRGFQVARLRYGGGGDWYSNPSSLPNLARAVAERTSIAVDTFEEKKVSISDERLFDYPFIYMNGHGTVHFSADEVSRLRSYLLSGGFLFADDNYGMDKSFRKEIARVFPEQRLVEVPVSHPIYHSFYDLPAGPPKVHEHDGLRAQGLGIVHDGRLVVFYTYQSDIGDGIEDAHVHNDPPAIREQAMKMAVNVVVYAMSS